MSPGEAFAELTHLMARLRSPDGCPWDQEQTHASIKPYLIEEAYEVVEAIEAGNPEELKNELGDVLLQVVFHAQMAAEAEQFTIVEVIAALCEKLRRRHPHVFGAAQVANADEVARNWSQIKAEERAGAGEHSAIAGIPRGMPALLRAQRTGEKASRVGFDWQCPEDVLVKVREEIGEMGDALARGDQAAVERELGDVLLALANLARHCRLNAEDALVKGADRFSARFRRLEQWFSDRGRDIRQASLEEQEAAWQEIKGGEDPSPAS